MNRAARIALIEHAAALLDARASEIYAKHVDPKRALRHPDDAEQAASYAELRHTAHCCYNLAAELDNEREEPAKARAALSACPGHVPVIAQPHGSHLSARAGDPIAAAAAGSDA